MTQSDPTAIRRVLEAAGLELYGGDDETIVLAERVRLHIMDSGVRVTRAHAGLAVEFTARSQRSDHPHDPEPALFDLVRARVGPEARERGYVEKDARRTEVRDPTDATRVLDVWYEIVYEKPVRGPEDLVDEVRWALSVDKFVHG
ncbi:MAG: hypothetical protein NZ898_03545 [Myxococcota bacterium]|nr:hypothetical protein [Myxococcota bacterium]